MSRGQRIGLGAGALLILGAAGGAGAMALTRPTVEMAPTVPTAIAHLGSVRGIVSVRGRVAEVYGDRFIVQDTSGRTLVDGGPHAGDFVHTAETVLVQGRFDNGQLHARYLVDGSGTVQEVGSPPPPEHRGPPPPFGGPGAPPPPGGPGAPPPPPPGGMNPDTNAPPPPTAPIAAGTADAAPPALAVAR